MNKIEGRLYIIGAGFAGQMIANDIAKKKSLEQFLRFSMMTKI